MLLARAAFTVLQDTTIELLPEPVTNAAQTQTVVMADRAAPVIVDTLSTQSAALSPRAVLAVFIASQATTIVKVLQAMQRLLVICAVGKVLLLILRSFAHVTLVTSHILGGIRARRPVLTATTVVLAIMNLLVV